MYNDLNKDQSRVAALSTKLERDAFPAMDCNKKIARLSIK